MIKQKARKFCNSNAQKSQFLSFPSLKETEDVFNRKMKPPKLTGTLLPGYPSFMHGCYSIRRCVPWP